MAASVKEEGAALIDAAGTKVELRRGGEGAPLLIIHGEFGVPGWLESHRRLADDFDVIVPSLPGYGQSPRGDWIMSVHDAAAWVVWLSRDLTLCTPIKLIGCSLGGWIAVEIAKMAPQLIDKLVLVGPMGIKPEQGNIFDYFLESGRTGITRAFHRPHQSSEFARFYGKDWTPEEIDLIEQHREMTCRIAWKPYMHSLTLRHFLPGIATPTLVVCGKDDAITPLECGEIYQRGIPGSRLVTIADCGHMPELEKPTEFVRLTRSFLLGG